MEGESDGESEGDSEGDGVIEIEERPLAEAELQSAGRPAGCRCYPLTWAIVPPPICRAFILDEAEELAELECEHCLTCMHDLECHDYNHDHDHNHDKKIWEICRKICRRVVKVAVHWLWHVWVPKEKR